MSLFLAYYLLYLYLVLLQSLVLVVLIPIDTHIDVNSCYPLQNHDTFARLQPFTGLSDGFSRYLVSPHYVGVTTI